MTLTDSLNVLTNEGKAGGEDEIYPVAVDGECDGKISGQTAPYKELVYGCPVIGVQTQLGKTYCDFYGKYPYTARVFRVCVS